ncbi:cobalamin biosynthesis protein [Rhodopseudomonas palustris]|uniref:Cobalamin biosynthesis protein G CbiG n=1 Tax=Rhodopseudomonas palustris (strain BisB18) TaxID=316056 RepID=Q217J6_RHOPB
MSRLVIGLGFRNEAPAASIGEVLEAARAQAGGAADTIAVPDDKSVHAGLVNAALAAGLPIEPIAAEAMWDADADITTRSAASAKHRGVGSVCEAAALAAAGDGARLVVSRIVSADRSATAAAAISKEPT